MLRTRFGTDDAGRDFHRITDFGRFPALAEDVRAVAVHPAPSTDMPRDSDWEVNFRRGLMRWNEWESIDPDRLRIEFDQTEGDFAELHGFWQLTPVPGGCEVCFELTYDFGIDSLAGIMDPIAERVVKRVICSVLAGLFGDITVLEGGEALVDLAGLAHRGSFTTPASDGGPSGGVASDRDGRPEACPSDRSSNHRRDSATDRDTARCAGPPELVGAATTAPTQPAAVVNGPRHKTAQR